MTFLQSSLLVGWTSTGLLHWSIRGVQSLKLGLEESLGISGSPSSRLRQRPWLALDHRKNLQVLWDSCGVYLVVHHDSSILNMSLSRSLWRQDWNNALAHSRHCNLGMSGLSWKASALVEVGLVFSHICLPLHFPPLLFNIINLIILLWSFLLLALYRPYTSDIHLISEIFLCYLMYIDGRSVKHFFFIWVFSLLLVHNDLGSYIDFRRILKSEIFYRLLSRMLSLQYFHSSLWSRHVLAV